MQIHIRSSKQQSNITVSVSEDATTADLKKAIQDANQGESGQMKLIYSGKILADNEPLSKHNIKDGSVVHMVVTASKPAAPTQPAPSAASMPSAPSQPSTDPLSGQAPNNNPFGFPFGGFGGNDGGFNNPFGFPNMPADYDLNNPQVQQIIDSLIDNPEMLRMVVNNPMFQANPMMRSFADMMAQNPEMIRQAFQMMRGFQNQGGDNSQNPGSAAGGFPGMGGLGNFNNLLNNPEFQRAMSDPDYLSNLYGNMSNLFGNNAPPPSTTSSLSDNDKALFYQITGMQETAETNSQISSAQGAKAVHQFVEAFKNLRKNNIQAFPNVSVQSAAPAAPAQPQSNEQRFAVQLQQMNDMGLQDNEKNIRALLRTNGNVNNAVELIFSGQV